MDRGSLEGVLIVFRSAVLESLSGPLKPATKALTPYLPRFSDLAPSTDTPSSPQELIKVSALQVAPAELEALLLTHPSIADAAVVGTSSSFADRELIRAYIVPVEGEWAEAKIAHVSPSEQDVINWMNARVAPHKRLTGGVKFVDAIPKSLSGKILRNVVREWAKKDMEDAKGGNMQAKLWGWAKQVKEKGVKAKL